MYCIVSHSWACSVSEFWIRIRGRRRTAPVYTELYFQLYFWTNQMLNETPKSKHSRFQMNKTHGYARWIRWQGLVSSIRAYPSLKLSSFAALQRCPQQILRLSKWSNQDKSAQNLNRCSLWLKRKRWHQLQWPARVWNNENRMSRSDTCSYFKGFKYGRKKW